MTVWVAARSDPTLRAALVPVETRFGREMHRLTVELLGADDESRPGVRESVQATLELMRGLGVGGLGVGGLGVASLLSDDSARRDRLPDEWTLQPAEWTLQPDEWSRQPAEWTLQLCRGLAAA